MWDTQNDRYPRRENSRGFTLIELTVVMFIIALVSAIAVPYLVPVLVFSELEGSARHLAGYGRAVAVEAAFQKDTLTVRFDMEKREISTVRWVLPADQEAEEAAAKAANGEEPEEDQWEKLQSLRSSGDALSGNDLREARKRGDETLYPEGFDQELADRQMLDRTYRFAKRLTEARAKNVKHDDSFLENVGPLFDKEFELDESNQPVEELMEDPILRRTKLPESVWVERIEVDGEAVRENVVEIEVDMLGFTQDVVFYLANEDGDTYTVVWDPVSGNTNAAGGSERPS